VRDVGRDGNPPRYPRKKKSAPGNFPIALRLKPMTMASREKVTSAFAPDLEEVRAWLQKMVAALRFVDLVTAVLALIARMRDINTELVAQLAHLRRSRPRSEVLRGLEQQLVLPIEGLIVPSAAKPTDDTTSDDDKKKRRRNHPGRGAPPAHLPRVPVFNRVPAPATSSRSSRRASLTRSTRARISIASFTPSSMAGHRPASRAPARPHARCASRALRRRPRRAPYPGHHARSRALSARLVVGATPALQPRTRSGRNPPRDVVGGGVTIEPFSEQPNLSLMRCRENADDHPRIWRDEMKLLRRAKEEMEVGCQKSVEVLRPHLLEGHRLISAGGPQAVPVERTDFPIKHLQLACSN
jgi:hypothetical protein